MRNLQHIKNIIIKIGSSSLCNDKGDIDSECFLGFIQQIAQLRKEGYQVTLVSSGAIRTGMKAMKLKKKPKTMPENQALAAIGQATLMRMYEEMLSLFHIQCAQILLNQDDFDNRKRLMNLTNALQALFSYGVLPIINENDTLAVDEIKVGDNDSIASLLVPTVNADLVILVSDIDGLYDKNPHQYKDAKLIHEVQQITPDIEAMASDAISGIGTGGMVTKLKAAKACNEYGCDLGIVNGNQENAIVDFVSGKEIGTYFNGQQGRKLNARQHWILYRSRAKGTLVVDEGCKQALLKHKSLLPSGIIDVHGKFEMSNVVSIKDEKGKEIARGIVYYSSNEIEQIQGHNTNEIETILGYKDYDVVIHANNMVLKKEKTK